MIAPSIVQTHGEPYIPVESSPGFIRVEPSAFTYPLVNLRVDRYVEKFKKNNTKKYFKMRTAALRTSHLLSPDY